MLDLVKTHIKKGSFSVEDVKKALDVSDLATVIKDVPYFYEVLD